MRGGVTPVHIHRPAADAAVVDARIRERAKAEAVVLALVRALVGRSRNGWGDVVDRDRLAAGAREDAVLVGQIDRDRRAGGPVGVGVADDAGGGGQGGRGDGRAGGVAPVDLVAADG